MVGAVPWCCRGALGNRAKGFKASVLQQNRVKWVGGWVDGWVDGWMRTHLLINTPDTRYKKIKQSHDWTQTANLHVGLGSGRDLPPYWLNGDVNLGRCLHCHGASQDTAKLRQRILPTSLPRPLATSLPPHREGPRAVWVFLGGCAFLGALLEGERGGRSHSARAGVEGALQEGWREGASGQGVEQAPVDEAQLLPQRQEGGPLLRVAAPALQHDAVDLGGAGAGPGEAVAPGDLPDGFLVRHSCKEGEDSPHSIVARGHPDGVSRPATGQDVEEHCHKMAAATGLAWDGSSSPQHPPAPWVVHRKSLEAIPKVTNLMSQEMFPPLLWEKKLLRVQMERC